MTTAFRIITSAATANSTSSTATSITTTTTASTIVLSITISLLLLLFQLDRLLPLLLKLFNTALLLLCCHYGGTDESKK